MSHSPMLNEWEMRSRAQAINRTAERMLLMRQAGGSSEQATASGFEMLRAELRRVANSATSASSSAAKGVLRAVTIWLGSPFVHSKDRSEA